jgi:predicted DNA-binding protein
MSTITIRLNSDEEKAFNEYAKLYGMPLSTLFKQTLEEKIEDEIDMKMIKEYEEAVKNEDVELYTHSEVKRILGL